MIRTRVTVKAVDLRAGDVIVPGSTRAVVTADPVISPASPGPILGAEQARIPVRYLHGVLAGESVITALGTRLYTVERAVPAGPVPE